MGCNQKTNSLHTSIKQAMMLHKEFHRTFNSTYFLSFLGDVAIGLFSFAISLFTSILGERLGMVDTEKAFWVGIVASGWGAVYWISPVLLGKASDKIGKKKTLIIGMMGFIIVNFLTLLFATHPVHLFIAYAGTGFFFGAYFPVLNAYASEASEHFGEKTHAKVLSRFMISWSIGLALGPLFGGIFEAFLNHLVSFIVLIFIATIIIAIARYFMLDPEQIHIMLSNNNITPLENHTTDQGTGFIIKDKLNLKLAIFSMPFLTALTSHVMLAIFPAYGIEHVSGGFIFGSMDPALMTSILIFSLGAGRTFTFYQSASLSKRRMFYLILISPFVLFLTSFLIFILPVADLLIIIFPVFGAFVGYMFSSGLILLMETTTSGKGSQSGLYEGAVGVGTLAAGLLSSLVGMVDPSFPFLMAAICAIINAMLILIPAIIKAKHQQSKKDLTQEIH